MSRLGAALPTGLGSASIGFWHRMQEVDQGHRLMAVVWVDPCEAETLLPVSPPTSPSAQP